MVAARNEIASLHRRAEKWYTDHGQQKKKSSDLMFVSLGFISADNYI